MLAEHDPDERISLAPLDPETALKALMAVDPDAKPVDEQDAPPQPEQGEGHTDAGDR